MKTKIWYVIGVMSGTSLDGVDIAYIKFKKDNSWHFEILNAKTYNYSKLWLQKLQDAFDYSKGALIEIDKEYGNYLADLINQFIEENKLSDINFIASHGHTIHHQPEKKYTLQIGNGDIIAKKTNIKTIYDFRTQDVAFGGQGAPLVPIGDELLFADYTYCLNLGGFANISYKNKQNRIAYDICAVNTVLNYYVKQLGFDYDDKGSIASKGTIDNPLLTELNSLDYYNLVPPKSLGIEYVINIIIPLIEKHQLAIETILRTYVEHIAIQISKDLKKDGKLLITGGGTFNSFLIKRLKFYSKNEIIIPNNLIIDFKEALIFAFLGLLKLENKANCLKSVTGADKDHSSGVIALP